MPKNQSEIDALLNEFNKRDSERLDALIDDYSKKVGVKRENGRADYKPKLSEADTGLSEEKLKGAKLPPKEHRVLDGIESRINAIRNSTFEAVDILQFQDINRQKVERVISVIKALHDYLDNWFASDNENAHRARIAHTIVNDSEKQRIDQEVEEIIKQM